MRRKFTKMTLDLGPVRDLVSELRPLIGARTEAAVLRAGVAALARSLNEAKGAGLDVPGAAPTAALPYPDPADFRGGVARRGEQDEPAPEQTPPRKRGGRKPCPPPEGGT